MKSLDQSKIAIIGLGYVGLPLAVAFGKKYPVVGFDINSTRVAELQSGRDHTLETDEEELSSVLSSKDSEKGLFCSADDNDLADAMNKSKPHHESSRGVHSAAVRRLLEWIKTEKQITLCNKPHQSVISSTENMCYVYASYMLIHWTTTFTVCHVTYLTSKLCRSSCRTISGITKKRNKHSVVSLSHVTTNQRYM